MKELRTQWQRIASLQEHPNVFSTWEWNSCWWEAYGREDSLYVLVMRREDEIVVIAPFCLVRKPKHSRAALRVLKFIGSNGDSGLLNILTLPGTQEMVWRRIFLFLATNRDWDILELNNLDESMATCQLVADEAKRQQWLESSYQSPIMQIRLPQSWDQFLTGISAKLRRQLTLAEHKLKEKYQVTYAQPRTDGELKECLERFFELHMQRWAMKGKEGAFDGKRRSLYHLVASAARNAGWLDFWELRLSGRTAAVEFGLRYGGCRYAMQSGFATEFAHYSVGRLLEAYSIRSAIERGDCLYDFLSGLQKFKLRWGAEPRNVLHIRIIRPWSLGSLAIHTAKLLGKGRRYKTGRHLA